MYRLSPTLRTTSSEEGGVVLDIAQGRMFELNPIATRMVSYLGEGRAKEEIIDTISREFETSRETVSSDFQQFLEILLENQLVEKDSLSDH